MSVKLSLKHKMDSKTKRIILAFSVLALSLAFTRVYASITTGTMSVSTNVIPSCITTTSSVNFGNITGEPASANGDISVTCSVNAVYHIALDSGLHYATGTRNLSDGGAGKLGYALYKDPALAAQWGDADYANTYPSGTSLADIGNGASQAHTVYGRLFPGTGPAGTYTDIVTVRVIY